MRGAGGRPSPRRRPNRQPNRSALVSCDGRARHGVSRPRGDPCAHRTRRRHDKVPGVIRQLHRHSHPGQASAPSPARPPRPRRDTQRRDRHPPHPRTMTGEQSGRLLLRVAKGHPGAVGASGLEATCSSLFASSSYVMPSSSRARSRALCHCLVRRCRYRVGRCGLGLSSVPPRQEWWIPGRPSTGYVRAYDTPTTRGDATNRSAGVSAHRSTLVGHSARPSGATYGGPAPGRAWRPRTRRPRPGPRRSAPARPRPTRRAPRPAACLPW